MPTCCTGASDFIRRSEVTSVKMTLFIFFLFWLPRVAHVKISIIKLVREFEAGYGKQDMESST